MRMTLQSDLRFYNCALSQQFAVHNTIIHNFVVVKLKADYTYVLSLNTLEWETTVAQGKNVIDNKRHLEFYSDRLREYACYFNFMLSSAVILSFLDNAGFRDRRYLKGLSDFLESFRSVKSS